MPNKIRFGHLAFPIFWGSFYATVFPLGHIGHIPMGSWQEELAAMAAWERSLSRGTCVRRRQAPSGNGFGSLPWALDLMRLWIL